MIGEVIRVDFKRRRRRQVISLGLPGFVVLPNGGTAVVTSVTITIPGASTRHDR